MFSQLADRVKTARSRQSKTLKAIHHRGHGGHREKQIIVVKRAFGEINNKTSVTSVSSAVNIFYFFTSVS